MHMRSRSPGARSASPRMVKSLQAKPGRQQQNLSFSNSSDAVAVRFVAQLPNAPQPLAPPPLAVAPLPWPLPAPGTLAISDYSGNHSPSNSTQGVIESLPSPLNQNSTEGASEFLPSPLNQLQCFSSPDSNMSVAVHSPEHRPYAPQSSSSSSWQAQNDQQR